MAFYCYILRCSDGSYYTGHTDNLEHRIAQHQSGDIPCYTQTRRSVTLAWSQDFPTRHEALTAERQIKGWSRTKKTALVASDWTSPKEAAIPRAERALRLRSGRTED
jgi:predicted GIY-YIG superfamily endonuclease